MAKTKILKKYLGILILFLLIINLVGFLAPFSEEIQRFNVRYKLRIYLRYIFGILLFIMALLDFKKLEISSFNFAGVALLILLNYFFGTLLLILFVMVNREGDEKNKRNGNSTILDDSN